jgi:membrane fusion protein (multidrug efflux system)
MAVFTDVLERLPMRRGAPAAILAAALAAACSGEAPEASERRPGGRPEIVPVVAERPERRSLDDVFLVREATLLPIADATISTRQEGFVRRLVPEAGDILHEGDLIAEIDPSDRQLRVNELRAELRRARTALDVEKQAFERIGELFERNIVSEGERDTSRAALERARAELEQARAQLERGEQDLAELKITAPMPGVITQHFTESGEYLERGDAVTTLKRIDVMFAVCTVNERFLADVEEGSPALVEVTAFPGRRFEGLVWKIIGDALIESRSFPVKIVLQNPDLALKPGMSARVSFTRRLENAVLVPKDAVLDPTDAAHVYVVREGVAVRRPVTLGSAVDQRWQVHAGVGPEDLVIVTGNEDLEDGWSVKLVELPPPGPPTLPESRQAERRGRSGS